MHEVEARRAAAHEGMSEADHHVSVDVRRGAEPALAASPVTIIAASEAPGTKAVEKSPPPAPGVPPGTASRPCLASRAAIFLYAGLDDGRPPIATLASGAMTTVPRPRCRRAAARLLGAIVTLLTIPSVVLTGRASVSGHALTGKSVWIADMYSIGVASASAL